MLTTLVEKKWCLLPVALCVWSFSLCPLVVPLAFLNISFDGHCGNLQSWLIESILLIILNVWIMAVLCLLKFKVGSRDSISLLLYGSPFVSGTSRVACH